MEKWNRWDNEAVWRICVVVPGGDGKMKQLRQWSSPVNLCFHCSGTKLDRNSWVNEAVPWTIFHRSRVRWESETAETMKQCGGSVFSSLQDETGLWNSWDNEAVWRICVFIAAVVTALSQYQGGVRVLWWERCAGVSDISSTHTSPDFTWFFFSVCLRVVVHFCVWWSTGASLCVWRPTGASFYVWWSKGASFYVWWSKGASFYVWLSKGANFYVWWSTGASFYVWWSKGASFYVWWSTGASFYVWWSTGASFYVWWSTGASFYVWWSTGASFYVWWSKGASFASVVRPVVCTKTCQTLQRGQRHVKHTEFHHTSRQRGNAARVHWLQRSIIGSELTWRCSLDTEDVERRDSERQTGRGLNARHLYICKHTNKPLCKKCVRQVGTLAGITCSWKCFFFTIIIIIIIVFTSQQHASVSQGRVWLNSCTCCHTEIQLAEPSISPVRY